MFKNKGLLLGIAVLFCLLIETATILYSIGQTVATLENKVEISIIANKIDINKLKIQVEDGFALFTEIAKMQLAFDKQRKEEIEFLYAKVQRESKTIDNPDVNRILSANVLLTNRKSGCIGSGTHIIIKNQHYILTCSHLTDTDEEPLWILEGEREYFLLPVKVDRELDVALYKFTGASGNIASLEVSEEEPRIGSEVTIVGNPARHEDVVTEGIIAYKDRIHYGFTNTIWFGNSGGALLYRNKVVGIVVQLDAKLKPPLFVCYGKAVKLNHIKEFLREFTE